MACIVGDFVIWFDWFGWIFVLLSISYNGLKKFFADAEIMELDLLIGLINLTNRFTDPMGLEVEFPEEKI